MRRRKKSKGQSKTITRVRKKQLDGFMKIMIQTMAHGHHQATPTDSLPTSPFGNFATSQSILELTVSNEWQ